MTGHNPEPGREDQPLVLVVDDDLSFIRFLTVVLQNAGFRTTSAADGQTGLAICEKYRPNVVLLDLDVPDISGFDLCEQIKGQLSTADIPVIFVTGADRSDDMIERCFAIGANDFIVKPVSRVDVLARLRVVLREQQLREAYRRLALEDPFTTLANRRQLFINITEAVMTSKRDHTACIFIIGDIDNLLAVNDLHGYDLGDELILTFARLIKRISGPDTRAGRLGGDELAIVVKNSTKEAGLALANRLRQTFSSIAFDADTSPKHFTVGFGLACFEGDDKDFSADDFLREADTALFASKQLGRNRVVAHWQLDPENMPEITPGKRHGRTRPRTKTNRAFIGVPAVDNMLAKADAPAKS